MTNDTEPMLDYVGDVGVYPDPAGPEPLEPRSTADFINDMWADRGSPVYALRPKELQIVASRTFKGFLWRFILWVCRYKGHGAVSSLNKLAPDSPCAFGLGMPDPLPTDPSATEMRMRHYLTVAEQFTPKPPPDEVTGCDCTEFHQEKPKKRTVRKNPPKKSSPRPKNQRPKKS